MSIPPTTHSRSSDVIPFVQTVRRTFPLQQHRPVRLAVIGSFPPRHCGIATFTSDMVNSIQQAEPDCQIDIYATASRSEEEVARRVRRVIVEDDRESYVAAGLEIEDSAPDAVWVQHEFGIFGGPAGAMLLDLLSPISAPLIVTFHTVLDQPNAEQRHVMDWLIAHASKLVVMSRQSADTLRQCYGAQSERVEIIEHGVPDRPFGRSAAMKRRFGLEGRRVMLTFGLISPGKGIEVAISALRQIVSEFPDATYVIAGATHPRLVASEGERYRERLKQLAAEIGVADHIMWIEHYLEDAELLDLIEAADIYLTPYASPVQATSGTLSYAVALGKAVVSTPYLHASELLADGHGVLTPFGDSDAMAAAIRDLLGDPPALLEMQQKSYRRGRSMTWGNFGTRSLEVIEAVRVSQPLTHVLERLGSTRALDRLCDGTGMLQHSRYCVPDRSHGYCVDDNARALMLANVSIGDFADRAECFASFVQHSWNPDSRRFRNFMRFDRSWCEDAGSQDSCGRTLWAIGATAADAPTADLRLWARELWRETAWCASEFDAPRAIAFSMLGACRLLEVAPGDPFAMRIVEDGAARLLDLLESASSDGWRWFEPVLSYDNCRLPEALLGASVVLRDAQMQEAALSALEWIAAVQTGHGGRFRPVGSEGFGAGSRPGLRFDQQPVDAWATVDAAAAAWRQTGDERWMETAKAAYAWFSGANDRGAQVADTATGGCFDAVTPHGVNHNQGAESVLSLHLAHHAMMRLLAGARRAAGNPHENEFGRHRQGSSDMLILAE